jgi:hypothetical protein
MLHPDSNSPIFQLGCLDPLTTPQWTQHTHTHRSPKDEVSGRRHQENDAQHQSGEHAAAGWISSASSRALSLSALSILLIRVVYSNVIRNYLCMSVHACCNQ